jgi:dihydrofolate reductase
MTINLIAAMSENRVIGREGRLPWGHLPEDWAHLFRVTDGIPMIMGRKSYDTPDRIGSPNAPNIVVTSQADFPMDAGFERAESLDKALQNIENQGFAQVFVIGGGAIFEQIMSRADVIYLRVTRFSPSFLNQILKQQTAWILKPTHGINTPFQFLH